MKKSKKIRIIFSTVAVILLVTLAVVGFFVYESKKSYEEKSEIGFSMGSVVSVKTFGNNNADGIEKSVVEHIESCGNSLTEKVFYASGLSDKYLGDAGNFDKSETEMILKTKQIYSKTDGKAALTVGWLSKLWDFNSGKKIVPEKKDIEKKLETVNDDNLIIDSGKVKVINASMLDLGSVGKGFACDKAAAVLEENGIKNAVVAVGGSIYAKGYTAKNQPVRVGIRNPFGNENEYFGYISASDAFISTSGNYEKVFEKDGKRYHHLLDCTTGYPVEGNLVSVTVVCDNGAKSDALSTACFVLGYGEKALSLLKEENAQAIFVFNDKSVKMSKSISDIFTLTDNGFSVNAYES